MRYDYVKPEDQHDILIRAIMDREREHYNYEMNRVNYDSILGGEDFRNLPDEWPDSLIKFKNLGSEQLAIQLQGEDYEVATRMQFRDHIRKLQRTTCCEQRKCETVYSALKAQLPEDPALVEAAAARILAKEARAISQFRAA